MPDPSGIADWERLLAQAAILQTRVPGAVLVGGTAAALHAGHRIADLGLILTTGIFSREARREARRDGAPPIDLVDRERLLDILKELRLGVEVELVESVSIDSKWFSNL